MTRAVYTLSISTNGGAEFVKRTYDFDEVMKWLATETGPETMPVYGIFQEEA